MDIGPQPEKGTGVIYETETANPSTIFLLMFTRPDGEHGLPDGVTATHTPAEVCPEHCDFWDLENPIKVKRG